MNRYEQALVDAVRQITKDNAAHAASDARWLLGMVMNAAPQLSGQREYKLFTSLLSCNGNRILAEAAKKPATARDAEVERLVQRLQSDFLLDEASARRICALYLAGITGDESYIRALDSAGNKANHAPQTAPKPKQRPQPQQRPAPSPAPAQPTPAPKQSPAPAPVPWPQKTPPMSLLKYKNWHLRFVPMLMAVLYGAIIFPLLEEKSDIAATVLDMPFCLLYVLAAVYCYIIAFPYDAFAPVKKWRQVLRFIICAASCVAGDEFLCGGGSLYADMSAYMDLTSKTGNSIIGFFASILLDSYFLLFFFGIGVALHYLPRIWSKKSAGADWSDFEGDNFIAFVVFIALYILRALVIYIVRVVSL